MWLYPKFNERRNMKVLSSIGEVLIDKMDVVAVFLIVSGGMYDMDGTWGLPPWNITGWKSAETVFQDDYSAVAEGDGHTTNLLYDRVGNLFSADIVSRYQELRSSVLSADNINAEFDRFMSNIPPYLYEEDYASTTGNGNFTNIPLKTTNNAIQIRQFVIDRLAYVDSMIL